MKKCIEVGTLHDVRIAFDFHKLRELMSCVQYGQRSMQCILQCIAARPVILRISSLKSKVSRESL